MSTLFQKFPMWVIAHLLVCLLIHTLSHTSPPQKVGPLIGAPAPAHP